MSAQRKLVGILAADVVGYTRRVETNEAAALADLQSFRTDILVPSVASHDGRIVKHMGDGVLAEFGSIVDAVRCAVAIRDAVFTGNGSRPVNDQLRIRLGVHLGDVVADGDDILGDGVNVAARLEQNCPPGGLLISGEAYDQLAGKIAVSFRPAGEQRFKNLSRPIRTYLAGQCQRRQADDPCCGSAPRPRWSRSSRLAEPRC